MLVDQKKMHDSERTSSSSTPTYYSALPAESSITPAMLTSCKTLPSPSRAVFKTGSLPSFINHTASLIEQEQAQHDSNNDEWSPLSPNSSISNESHILQQSNRLNWLHGKQTNDHDRREGRRKNKISKNSPLILALFFLFFQITRAITEKEFSVIGLERSNDALDRSGWIGEPRHIGRHTQQVHDSNDNDKANNKLEQTSSVNKKNSFLLLRFHLKFILINKEVKKEPVIQAFDVCV